MSLTRRAFVGHLAAVVGAGTLRMPTSPAPLRIGLVVPRGAPTSGDRAPAALLGATLGVAEAERAASLLGGAVSLLTGDDPHALVHASHATVLLGGADDREAGTLARLVGDSALFVNVGAGGDALRGAAPRVFHVAPSDAMRRAAAVAAHVPPSSVTAWHASLVPFGAGQLNARYQARFARAMDERAWAAWLAVKIVAEAAQRARATDAATLAAALARPGARFDGQKGAPLVFDAVHQLAQPLYAVRAGPGGEQATAIAMSGRPG